MTIQLYGLGPSRSFRCLWALEEAGLEYDFHNINIGRDDENGGQHANYLKINPQGKIPTLIDDEFVLTESAAIVNYIDAKANSNLIPASAQQRARYDELSSFVTTELEQPLWSNGKHRFALPKEQRLEAMLDVATWEYAKAVKAFDALFPFDQYVLGDEFSMADVLVAHTVHWADRFKFDVPKKHLEYRDQMFSRDAAKRALSQIE